MYAWLWRHLPFRLPGRLITAVILVVAVGVLLWRVVFPMLEPILLPFDDVQVGAAAGHSSNTMNLTKSA